MGYLDDVLTGMIVGYYFENSGVVHRLLTGESMDDSGPIEKFATSIEASVVFIGFGCFFYINTPGEKIGDHNSTYVELDYFKGEEIKNNLLTLSLKLNNANLDPDLGPIVVDLEEWIG